MNGIGMLKKEMLESCLLTRPAMRGRSEKTVLTQEARLSRQTCQHLDPDFPTSRTVKRNVFC